MPSITLIDIHELFGTRADVLHRVDDLAYDLSSPLSHSGSAQGKFRLVGLRGVASVVAHCGAKLVHGRGRLLKCTGLFFRALAQVGIPVGDLG